MSDQKKAEQIAADVAKQLKGGAFTGGEITVKYGKGEAKGRVDK